MTLTPYKSHRRVGRHRAATTWERYLDSFFSWLGVRR